MNEWFLWNGFAWSFLWFVTFCAVGNNASKEGTMTFLFVLFNAGLSFVSFNAFGYLLAAGGFLKFLG
jgi:hypothetical protein